MKIINLSGEEIKFAINVDKILNIFLIPVPFFIVSVSLLNYRNTEIINSLISELENNEEFIAESKINKDRFGLLLTSTAKIVLWKRSWMMRLQWILQIIAITITIMMLLQLLLQ